jgi:hypothetical protein
VPCDRVDKHLFSACTTIVLGNGGKCSFWCDRWLHGSAPQCIAPLLFQLARRKNLLVKVALEGSKWMKGLERISSVEEMDQFFILWQKIQNVELSNAPDSISWSLTEDGCYSAKSAYEFQFKTRLPLPHLRQVWKVKAEPKIRFHCWLLLQDRLWTADRLHRRGMPAQDLCPLCDQVPESAVHLSILCPFAKEVWQAFSSDHPLAAAIGTSATSIRAWWRRIWKLNRDKTTKVQATAAVYIVWSIWKELGVFSRIHLLSLALLFN